MAGTRAGGLAAAITNKQKYGSDFYAKIGAKGGKNGHTGGFADDNRSFIDKLLRRPKRAVWAGRKGGKTSRRRPASSGTTQPETEMRAIRSVIPPHNIFYVEVKKK